jgi:hypothetical protein
VKLALVEASLLGNLTSLFLKAGKSLFRTWETSTLNRIEIRGSVKGVIYSLE